MAVKWLLLQLLLLSAARNQALGYRRAGILDEMPQPGEVAKFVQQAGAVDAADMVALMEQMQYSEETSLPLQPGAAPAMAAAMEEATSSFAQLGAAAAAEAGVILTRESTIAREVTSSIVQAAASAASGGSTKAKAENTEGDEGVSLTTALVVLLLGMGIGLAAIPVANMVRQRQGLPQGMSTAQIYDDDTSIIPSHMAQERIRPTFFADAADPNKEEEKRAGRPPL